MKTDSLATFGFLALLVVSAVGCGGGGQKTHKVSGKVTYADGSPLTEGTVIFQGQKSQATGVIGSDGKYSLTSYKPGDGAPEGSYKVYLGGNIFAPPPPPPATGDLGSAAANQYLDGLPGGGEGKSLVNPKFSSADTSGLTCEVKGSMTFDITVEKP